MAEYGITDAGFVTRTFHDLLEDTRASLRDALGAEVPLEPDTALGVLSRIAADATASLWEVAAAVYDAQNPDSARARPLELLCALSGVRRKAATHSRVIARCTGAPGTVLAAGRRASVAGQKTRRFSSVAEATIGPGGFVDVEFVAEKTGPVHALSGTLTVIETPVSGWDAVSNPLDAELGQDIERDFDLLLRRELLLKRAGVGGPAAVRAALLDVETIAEAAIFENVDSIVRDGIPPRSFEAVVEGGSDAEVANAILGAKGVSIGTWGDISVAVADAAGEPKAIRFSRPFDAEVYVELTVRVDAAFPANGVEQLRAAVVEHGGKLQLGESVIGSRIAVAAFSVPGVVDTVSVRVGTQFTGPVLANVPLTPRDFARFDTSRVVVVVQ